MDISHPGPVKAHSLLHENLNGFSVYYISFIGFSLNIDSTLCLFGGSSSEYFVFL